MRGPAGENPPTANGVAGISMSGDRALVFGNPLATQFPEILRGRHRVLALVDATRYIPGLIRRLGMRFSKVLYVVPALLLSLPAVAAENPFEGPWAGYCGDNVQCEANFIAKGDGYRLTIRVADGLDDRKALCKVDIPMAKYASDVLVGGHGHDQQVRVARMRTGDVVISGVASSVCSGLQLNGVYRQFADE